MRKKQRRKGLNNLSPNIKTYVGIRTTYLTVHTSPTTRLDNHRNHYSVHGSDGTTNTPYSLSIHQQKNLPHPILGDHFRGTKPASQRTACERRRDQIHVAPQAPIRKAHNAREHYFAAPRIVDTSRAAGLAERLHHIRVATSHCGYFCIAFLVTPHDRGAVSWAWAS
jgi:hypothetical protein